MNTPQTENLEVPEQVINELVAILKQPYKDVCVICDGSGKGKDDKSDCAKCKGSGHRLLKLF